MGEDEHRGGSGEDRISGLPDELLHEILVCLRSAQAAGRTSVLSHRWRHVWAHLPALYLIPPREVAAAAAAAPASSLDTVDGALAGYLAPTLGHLGISLKKIDVPIITPGRVAPWLQFAAEHKVGEIHLFLPLFLAWFPPLSTEPEVVEDEAAVLELLAWEGAREILLFLTEAWRVRPQAAGLFRALTSLQIIFARMGGAELTALVCTQCPCLRHLNLKFELIAVSDVSMHSKWLRLLGLGVRSIRRLEVVAPNLEELTVSYQPVEAHISAPKLAKVAWNADVETQVNRFADVGRSLRVLNIGKNSAVPFLTRQFDEVDELKLDICIPQGVAGYESFLKETNKLHKCKSTRILLIWDHHALVPSMLHLLKRCNSTKKISVQLGFTDPRRGHYCSPSCPCRLEENYKIDGIALSSLEKVEISNFTGSLENMEVVEFLSCNAAILKRLVINYSRHSAPLSKEVCEKVRGICHANVKVKFNVFGLDGLLVPFE